MSVTKFILTATFCLLMTRDNDDVAAVIKTDDRYRILTRRELESSSISDRILL